MGDLTYRSVLRTCLIVVGVAFTIYLIYLLRKPIGWVLIARRTDVSREREVCCGS